MTSDKIYNNLELCRNSFRKFIVTSNYNRFSDGSISWDNYTPGIYKNLYAKEYELIVRNRQYSFLLSEDRGCIQFYYSFDDGKLTKAKLAYYPYPVKIRDLNDLEHSIYDADDIFIGEYYFDLWNILNHEFQLEISD